MIMTKELKLFCTSHKNVNYLDTFKSLSLVGCGEAKFNNNWLLANTNKNINHKFFGYADLVAQYWIWQNHIKKMMDQDIWVGISQYRRHWLNSNFKENETYNKESFNSIILLEKKSEWSSFESVLPSPFIFRTKFIDRITKLNFSNKKTTIKKQMFNSLGKNFEIIYADLL